MLRLLLCRLLRIHDTIPLWTGDWVWVMPNGRKIPCPEKWHPFLRLCQRCEVMTW